MNRPESKSRKFGCVGAVFLVPLVFFAVHLTVDLMMVRSTRPPASVKTIADFQAWKGKKVMGRRTYETGGTNYIVMLAPAGRTLASGPSAYLFNQNSNFVDWTSDMGDFKTRKFGFDLSGGRVKMK